MIPIEELALFAFASIALAFAPGPDNIFVLMQSALYGPSRGILVTLGLCTGLLVHTAAVALGVAALLEASTTAFNILKIVGASYLLYLAYVVFRAGSAKFDDKPQAIPSSFQLYRRGVILNVTNPKVAIFFLAFLPQFAKPEHGSMIAQMLLLGAIFMAVTFCVFGGIALAAGKVGTWLRNSEKAQIRMNRFAGVVFVLLAIRLLISAQ
ncbi:MAG: LysE family translocator [Planctomycetes bacterium]|nr:LysE family translocator [Planctomycetota bacterium]MCP4770490.1 LysE family translocator [Planctomycetota bacterium]MCP4859930.1 LysE family translocator [Planctomycetota bacterium]